MSPEREKLRAARRARIDSASAPLTRGSRATGTGGSGRPMPVAPKKKVAAKAPPRPRPKAMSPETKAATRAERRARIDSASAPLTRGSRATGTGGSRAAAKPAPAKKKAAAKPAPAKTSFKSAYAAARKKYGAGTGGDTFTWNGKKYSVASKDDLKKGRARKTKQGYKMTKKS